MKVLLVHPSPLMYSEIFLRLEPIGLERVASAVRAAGHEVRLLDLQIFGHADYYRELTDFAPHAVGFSLNYLANVPEVLDLAKETKRRPPGCPWDCSFCSAWTFYGRSYRKASPEAAAEDLARIAEPNVFIVDDVAFIHPEHGFAIGHELEKRKVRKQYYLETRCDVLLRNREVFEYWRRLGLHYMFLGLEALDEDALRLHRKRVTPGDNFKALEVARELGFTVAVNIIADPDWDERRFAIVREWALSVPEIVHLTVATPYPGTEIWHTESRRLTSLDYRLFDVQHAVLPTRLPLQRFYEELVATQAVINRKPPGLTALREVAGLAARLALRGQTNFLKMLWKFGSVYNRDRQYSDHLRPVRYQMRPPEAVAARPGARDLFVHRPARVAPG